jgi:hypothetical protein
VGFVGRVRGYFRSDLPLDHIEPWSRLGTDAYDLIDTTPPASWPRLAAWNAFVLQVYADELVRADTQSDYVGAESGEFAENLYRLVGMWLTEVRKGLADPAYSFRFPLPDPPPHWSTFPRTDEQLAAMRSALDTLRTRVASDLETFAGADATKGMLRGRLAELDSDASQVESLWTREPTDQLRGAIGDALLKGLECVDELGQLLAQPALMQQL